LMIPGFEMIDKRIEQIDKRSEEVEKHLTTIAGRMDRFLF